MKARGLLQISARRSSLACGLIALFAVISHVSLHRTEVKMYPRFTADRVQFLEAVWAPLQEQLGPDEPVGFLSDHPPDSLNYASDYLMTQYSVTPVQVDKTGTRSLSIGIFRYGVKPFLQNNPEYELVAQSDENIAILRLTSR